MEERRLILAFALSFAVLIGFRIWTNSRYPQPTTQESQAAQTTATAIAGTPAPSGAAQSPATATPRAGTTEDATVSSVLPTPTAPKQPVISGDERRIEIVSKEAEIAFSSKGARLLSWKLLEYKDPRGKAVEALPEGNPSPGPLDLITGKTNIDKTLAQALFLVTDIGGDGEKGARFDFSDGTLTVTKTVRTIKAGRAIVVEAKVTENGSEIPTQVFWGPGFGQPSADEKSLNGYLPPAVVEIDEAGAEARWPPSALQTPRQTRTRLVGIENKYFAVVFTGENGRPIDFSASVSPTDKDKNVQILVGLPVALTVGAKDYDRLKDLGLGAEMVVPVGSWLGPIVVPLTRALRAVNEKVGNYGIAIILLTLAISAALSPLRHYAILSSAKMAKVGPQIRAVQERYKRLSLTDPKRQQMQQEIAEVYEKNGIDMVRQTAAGCLPTLLTMPFLFAFYRMLDISVDLKGAPFFWIPDLSLKDPLFITPILSGLSMIAMQRLMPAPAVDPAQQRMMLLMPIIFSGMFAWAPAGLNLYWFISNLAAMLQQGLAMYFAPHLFPRTKDPQ
jgi:YidC/Oxa1 family membrane protein insertase